MDSLSPVSFFLPYQFVNPAFLRLYFSVVVNLECEAFYLFFYQIHHPIEVRALGFSWLYSKLKYELSTLIKVCVNAFSILI